MKVLPCSSALDVSDCVAPHAIIRSDNVGASGVVQNGQSLSLGQFGNTHYQVFSAGRSSKPVHIGHVGFLVIPPKVAWINAAWIAAIAMAREVVWRSRPRPSIQNQRYMVSQKSSVVDSEGAVTIFNFTAKPKPTFVNRRFFDFGPVARMVKIFWGEGFQVKLQSWFVANLDTTNWSFSKGARNAF